MFSDMDFHFGFNETISITLFNKFIFQLRRIYTMGRKWQSVSVV